MRVTREAFQAAIEQGIERAGYTGGMAEKLRTVGRTATAFSVGLYQDSSTGAVCPIQAAFNGPTRNDGWFTSAFDRAIRELVGHYGHTVTVID